MYNPAPMLTDSALPNNVVTRSLTRITYYTIVTVLKVVFIVCYALTPKSKKDAFVENVVAKLNKFAA